MRMDLGSLGSAGEHTIILPNARLTTAPSTFYLDEITRLPFVFDAFLAESDLVVDVVQSAWAYAGNTQLSQDRDGFSTVMTMGIVVYECFCIDPMCSQLIKL